MLNSKKCLTTFSSWCLQTNCVRIDKVLDTASTKTLKSCVADLCNTNLLNWEFSHGVDYNWIMNTEFDNTVRFEFANNKRTELLK